MEVVGSVSGKLGRLQALLRSLGLQPLSDTEAEAAEAYLALLVRWNAKMNLTAIRDESTILRRHFLESILCARLLPAGIATLLDYGSGAGFPGVICAIVRPEVRVTLAESQGKKAAFLAEVVRSLSLNTTVYQGRVEAMPHADLYDAVTLRAVDDMRKACMEALAHIAVGGWMAILTTEAKLESVASAVKRVAWREPQKLVGTAQEVLLLGRRLAE